MPSNIPVTASDLLHLVGRLTQEQSVYLLKRLIVDALPEKELFAALNEALTQNQKEELGESWFNIDRK